MNNKWIICPHCGKKQFPLQSNTSIMFLEYKCKMCGMVFEIVHNISKLITKSPTRITN